MRPGVTAAGILSAAGALAMLGQVLVSRERPDVLPPGYVVDSILPPEEALRRFRAGVAPVTRLEGPASRDELVERFLGALLARDSAALARLAIDRAEFAYLVYPESRLARPPYRQPPEIAWLTLRLASEGGLRRLLSRAPAVHPLGIVCPDSAVAEGRMRITTGCAVRVREAGATRPVRLFGRLVELDGRWKIVGFDGDL